eukprot:1844801-Pleurochrysis_carterae.AAC.2
MTSLGLRPPQAAAAGGRPRPPPRPRVSGMSGPGPPRHARHVKVTVKGVSVRCCMPLLIA